MTSLWGNRARIFAAAAAGCLLAWTSAPEPAWAQYREDQRIEPRILSQDYSVDYEAQAAPIDVEHYTLDVDLEPEIHQVKARAEIRFRARENLSVVELELNNNLYPTNIEGEQGQALSGRRIGNGLKVEVTLDRPVARDQSSTLVLEYEGTLEGTGYSPVENVELARIAPEGTFLLYASRWMPLSGYGTDRYTAEIRVRVPAGGYLVSGGRVSEPVAEGGQVEYTVAFDQPQLGGSMAVWRQPPQVMDYPGARVEVFFTPERQDMARVYGEAAAHMLNFFAGRFGHLPPQTLSVVELPDSSLGGYAGPGVVFLASRAIGSEVNVRLLAQEVAQQWWRGLVGPATPADLWLDHGLATYSEALYLEEIGGPQALEERIREMAIDALTHDVMPVRAASRYAEFSLPYKTLLYDKAAYVLHMLRWVVGDEAFFRALREFAQSHAHGQASTDDFRVAMEQAGGQSLEGFFLQWLESTGASDFTVDYTIYRVPEGFRIAGSISQDQDLFSMPVEVQVETEGEPVTERVQVTGRSSEFSIHTVSRPSRMVVDPYNRVLKYNDDIRLRVAIARGEQAMSEQDYTLALEEYQKALDINRLSSLAHYRVGEVFFALRNYQSAANSFREALNGDLEPQWTEVWSHINLGKIFDVTGQRDRAVNEYQQAVRTRDDTQGALQEANQYLQEPYVRTREGQSGG